MVMASGGFGVASRAALQRPQALTGTPGTGMLRKATNSMGGNDAMGIGTALANPATITPNAAPGVPAVNYTAQQPGFGAAVSPTLDQRNDRLTAGSGQALNNSGQQYQDAYGNFGTSIDQFTGAAGRVGSFQPTATMGVTNAINPNFQQYTPQSIQSLGLGDYLSQAGSSAATQGVNFSNIENFDPSGAINTYAKGAFGEVQHDLGTQLDDIRNQDARLGRLNTGFFDKDRGVVMNRAMDSFNNQLAQTAVQGAGLKLNALTSAGGLNLSRAQAIDAATRAGGSAGLGAALQLAGMNESGRQFDVNQDYTRASGTNAFNLNQSQFVDTSRQNAGNQAAGYYGQAAGLAGQRAGMAQNQYNTDFGNYAGLVTGGLDRNFQQQQFNAQNKQNDKQNKINRTGSVIGGVGTGAATGAMIGSIIPGVGTAIGAGVGGLIGGIGSFFGGR